MVIIWKDQVSNYIVGLWQKRNFRNKTKTTTQIETQINMSTITQPTLKKETFKNR